MRVNSSRRTVAALALEARTQGEHVSEFAGDCATPVEMQLFGYPDKLLVNLGLDPERNVYQLARFRCRKCQPCLMHRRRLWTARAIAECAVARRSWFGTLTLTSDRQLWARYSALKQLEERVSDLSAQNIFRTSCSVLAPELTRFLKRLRGRGRKLRYLLVTEAHQSGLPHFHLLLHETGEPIPKRMLEDKWRYGFSHWRLVDGHDPKAAGYACKYLSKTLATRVRSSQDYGSVTEPLAERIVDATRTILGAQAASNGTEKPRLVSNQTEVKNKIC